MVRIEAGAFHMGSESPAPFPADGEGPDDRQDYAGYAFKHDVPPETILGGDYGACGLSSGSDPPYRDP